MSLRWRDIENKITKAPEPLANHWRFLHLGQAMSAHWYMSGIFLRQRELAESLFLAHNRRLKRLQFTAAIGGTPDV